MRDLTIKMNGNVIGYAHSMDQAETVAEELWADGRNHTQVIDETGNIVCEFEV